MKFAKREGKVWTNFTILVKLIEKLHRVIIIVKGKAEAQIF